MTTGKQPGGRPRQGHIDHAIAAAVQGLVTDHGYASLSVEAVAARAAVSKAAIYRRYANKQEMAVAVLLRDLREDAPADTGSLHGDLAAFATRMGEQLGQSSAEVMVGLLADVHAEAARGAHFAENYASAERSIITTLLDRAVARGELSHHPDPAIVQVLLLGPLFAWLILLNEEPRRAPGLARTVAGIIADALTAGVLPPAER